MKRSIAAFLATTSFIVASPSVFAESTIRMEGGKAMLRACNLGVDRVSIFQGGNQSSAMKSPLVATANGSGCVVREIIVSPNPNDTVYITAATSNAKLDGLKILAKLVVDEELNPKKAAAPAKQGVTLTRTADGNFSVTVCHDKLEAGKAMQFKVGNPESLDNSPSKVEVKDGKKCVQRTVINTIGGGKPLYIVYDGKVLASPLMPESKGSSTTAELNFAAPQPQQQQARPTPPQQQPSRPVVNAPAPSAAQKSNSQPRPQSKNSIGLVFSQKNDPNYPVRYGVVIDVECDMADLFKVAIYDDGEKPDFQKISPENLTSTRDGFCRINREVSPKDIEEQILEVRLYQSIDEGKNYRSASSPVYIRVPCDGVAKKYAQTKETVNLRAGIQNIASFDCPIPQIIPQVQAPTQNGQQPQQYCSITTKLFGQENAQVQILARCDLDASSTDIVVTQNRQSILEKTLHFRAGETREIGVVNRPKTSSVNFNVELRTKQGVFNSSKTFFKDPTFDYDPEITLLSAQNDSPERARKLNLRGYKWESEVRVKASDRDVDNGSQELIDIELFNKTLNRVIGEATVTNNREVTFPLKVDYIVPVMWGDSFWNEKPSEVNLQKGRNVLVVRVYDAYQDDNYIELPQEIIVDVTDKVEETEKK